jgi:hypothetical protein
MPTLSLLIFKSPPLLPKRLSHWAFYLPPEDEQQCGRIYSVKKKEFSSEYTQLIYEPFDPGQDKSLLCIEIPSIGIERGQLLTICEEVTKDRRFNLMTRNCQDWVEEVIKKVEEDLNIVKRVDVVALAKTHGYTTFRG